MQEERLPQRMVDVLTTIGENAVLFHIFVLTMKYPDWNVFQNLSDKGCDLILLHNNGAKIRLEVKTRQKLYTTTLINKDRPQFTLSESEYLSSDFLIGFWFERNIYYIVPRDELRLAKNGAKNTYKYIVTSKSDEHIDNWSLIECKMIEMSNIE